jgi:hypothetical protein
VVYWLFFLALVIVLFWTPSELPTCCVVVFSAFNQLSPSFRNINCMFLRASLRFSPFPCWTIIDFMKRQMLRVIHKSRDGVPNSRVIATFFRPYKQVRIAGAAKATENKRFVCKNDG